MAHPTKTAVHQNKQQKFNRKASCKTYIDHNNNNGGVDRTQDNKLCPNNKTKITRALYRIILYTKLIIGETIGQKIIKPVNNC
jgi:hypothetical protein